MGGLNPESVVDYEGFLGDKEGVNMAASASNGLVFWRCSCRSPGGRAWLPPASPSILLTVPRLL